MTRTARIGLRDGDVLEVNGTRIRVRIPHGRGRKRITVEVTSDKQPVRRRAIDSGKRPSQ